MSFLLSSNMNLPIPSVGTEPGPNYAFDVNNSLTLIDQHDHTPGKGVQITPSGLNINSSLNFQNQFAVNMAGVTFLAQGSPPANNTIYESGVDLFFVDGLGNNIRITQSGGIAGSPGSIANLTPPASASYVAGSSTFVWQSNTNIAANMDFGSAVFRNLSPNSTFGVTVQPPAALSNNYSLTLPTIPGTISFLTLDTSGNIAGSTPYPLTNAGIANNTIQNSKFATGTQIPVAVTSVSTTYTAVITDGLIEADSSGGAFTITLYSAVSNPGLTLKILKTSSDLNAITITDGTYTSSVNTQGECLTIQSDGTTFKQISRDIPSPIVSAGLISTAITGTSSNPTFGTITTDIRNYQRDGIKAKVSGSFRQTTSGTTGSGLYLFALPAGMTIDTSLAPGSTDTTTNGVVTANAVTFVPSYGYFIDSTGPVQGEMTARVYDSTHIAFYILANSTHEQWTASGDVPFNHILGFNFTFEVPIVGWRS